MKGYSIGFWEKFFLASDNRRTSFCQIMYFFERIFSWRFYKTLFQAFCKSFFFSLLKEVLWNAFPFFWGKPSLASDKLMFILPEEVLSWSEEILLGRVFSSFWENLYQHMEEICMLYGNVCEKLFWMRGEAFPALEVAFLAFGKKHSDVWFQLQEFFFCNVCLCWKSLVTRWWCISWICGRVF